MTEAAAPTERVRPDQGLPITPARVAVLQEACAVASAIHSALDLGVVARVTEGPADTAAVAADCGLTQQGAQALLSALAGLVLRTGSGRIYPYSTFRRWLDEGGFEDTRRHKLPGPYPFTLITGRRR